MATYAPPSETLTLFNPDVFLTADLGDFLTFPVAQGSEVFPFGLTTSTATVAGALSAGTATVAGALSAGTSTLTSVITNTTTGTAVGTAVSLYGEATRTGGISIGTGNTTSSLPITIGNQSGSFGSVDIGSTTISIGKNNCATNNIGTSTGGTLNLKTGSTGGAVNMGTSMTSGTISIGNSSGSTILNLTSNTVNLQTATGSVLIGTTATAGVITIGGSSSNSLSIQRPIQLSSGADPASNTSAIGYILTNVTGGVGGAISVPVNKYTWSTGVMSLPIGVYMLSLYAEYVAAASVTAFNFNMGFMSSAPTTGDSATASSAPTNTISGINGNLRSDDNSNLTNGTYINQIGGVVVNNYGGTFNNVYGIFNADWITSGTITMSALTIRAIKIG